MKRRDLFKSAAAAIAGAFMFKAKSWGVEKQPTNVQDNPWDIGTYESLPADRSRILNWDEDRTLRPAKVFDGDGNEIRRVMQVDLDTGELIRLPDPPRTVVMNDSDELVKIREKRKLPIRVVFEKRNARRA